MFGPAAIVKDVIDGIAEAAFAAAFGTEAGASAIDGGSISPVGMPDHSDPHEAGFFKKSPRGVAQGGERLNPVHGTKLAGTPHEGGGNPGAPIVRMQHDPLEQPELGIKGLQDQAGTRLMQAEPAVAPMQGGGGSTEDANPDGPLAMPEQGHAPDAAEMVAPIMPPCEVRPVAHGTV